MLVLFLVSFPLQLTYLGTAGGKSHMDTHHDVLASKEVCIDELCSYAFAMGYPLPILRVRVETSAKRMEHGYENKPGTYGCYWFVKE